MPLPTRTDPSTPVRVAYERQTLQSPNPVARFAHRRRHRLSLALALRHSAGGGTVLDFGAGTGAFLHELGCLRPDLRLLAYEPFMAIGFNEVSRVQTLEQVADASLAAISAFEVCEHLQPAEIDGFLGHAHRLLRPDGVLLVSVPVMEGLALPLKEVSRALLFRRRSDYTARELVRGLVGRGVSRPENLLTSHKGFAHRDLWQHLESEFQPVEDMTSPLPFLPWWLNSQRFGVFRPRP